MRGQLASGLYKGRTKHTGQERPSEWVVFCINPGAILTFQQSIYPMQMQMQALPGLPIRQPSILCAELQRDCSTKEPSLQILKPIAPT